MAAKNTFQPTYQDTGLGTSYSKKSHRVINRDGSFNVFRKGTKHGMEDMYNTLINLSWPMFISGIVLVYFVLNLFYASIYLLIGVDQLSGAENMQLHDFGKAFFFSVQTLTTVGYGGVHPTGVWPNIVVSIELLNGLLGFAVITGLLYARFSKPNSKLRFSEHALIAPYKHGRSLQFRVVNNRKSEMTELEAKVTLSLLEHQGEKIVRRYLPVKLEISTILFFPLSWTIVHHIDEDSPLYHMDEKDWVTNEAEILIYINGFDDTYSQTVICRYSYRWDEIKWGAKYKPAFYNLEDGSTIMDNDLIDVFEEVELPHVKNYVS